MHILGIDPAYSGPAGFAVIDTRQPTHAMVRHVEVLTFTRGRPAPSRVEALWAKATDILAFYDIAAIGCEGTYQGINPQTVIGLSEAVGGLWMLAISRHLPFVRVAETQQRGTAQSYPYQLVGRWLDHIPNRKHWPHAVDAIAIAQVAAGEAARQRMAAA